MPTDGLVEQLRLIKDKDEVATIRRAAQVAERAFEVLRATIRPELTEKQVADDLEHQMRLMGAKGCQFSADRGRRSASGVAPRPARPAADWANRRCCWSIGGRMWAGIRAT